MSIQTEITRLQNLKNTLRTKLVALGLVQSTANLQACVEAVEGIEDKGAVSKTLDATAGNQSYTVPAGIHNGDGQVQIVLEEKSVTPSGAAQTVTPAAGKVLSKVTVAKIPSNYGDVSGVTAAAGDVLANKVFVDSTGAEKAGTMPDNGTVSASIDGLTTTSYTIPAGKHSGTGKVTLTGDIETALAAI